MTVPKLQIPEPSVVTISCAACGNPMLTVSAATAKAFSSGSWLCDSPACHAKRKAALDVATGRLL
jgi:hypothetical protein